MGNYRGLSGKERDHVHGVSARASFPRLWRLHPLVINIEPTDIKEKWALWFQEPSPVLSLQGWLCVPLSSTHGHKHWWFIRDTAGRHSLCLCLQSKRLATAGQAISMQLPPRGQALMDCRSSGGARARLRASRVSQSLREAVSKHRKTQRTHE